MKCCWNDKNKHHEFKVFETMSVCVFQNEAHTSNEDQVIPRITPTRDKAKASMLLEWVWNEVIIDFEFVSILVQHISSTKNMKNKKYSTCIVVLDFQFSWFNKICFNVLQFSNKNNSYI